MAKQVSQLSNAARESLTIQIVIIGLTIEVLLVALHGFNHITFDGRWLALDKENNLPTWFSSSQLLLAGAGWSVVSAMADSKRILWLGMAVVSMMLSLDESALIHDWLEGLVEQDLVIFTWQALVGIGVILLFITAIRNLQGLPRLCLIGAAVALTTSQVSSTIVGVLEPTYVLLVVLAVSEEFCEMLTGTLLFAATLIPIQKCLLQWAKRNIESEAINSKVRD